MKQVALVASSNALAKKKRKKIARLVERLEEVGLVSHVSNHIFTTEGLLGASPEERAQAVNEFYRRGNLKHIFDVSGGELANEILDLLDYELIKNTDTTYWGYSDVTTILNAIYTKTGKSSVLYQIRYMKHTSMKKLFDFKYDFVQGKSLDGIVIGGNIRCFLKLAGTEYMPDFTDKVLFLESYSGNKAKLRTFFSQLEQLGAFDKISGLILGTFTELEAADEGEFVIDLAQKYLKNRPIVKTKQLGHQKKSRAIKIGEKINLHR